MPPKMAPGPTAVLRHVRAQRADIAVPLFMGMRHYCQGSSCKARCLGSAGTNTRDHALQHTTALQHDENSR